jgi:hypothetical protein
MVILLLAATVVIGYLLTALAIPTGALAPRWAECLLKFALGFGGGVALVSLLFFVLLLLHMASFVVMLLAEAVLLVTSAALVFAQRRLKTPGEPRQRTAVFWWYWPLGGALVFAAMLVSAAMVHTAQTNLYGTWDAFLEWNLRARYLAGPDETWIRAFSPQLASAHADYPLLLSGFIAQLWKFSGGETSPLAPILTAALFAASVLALLVSAIAIARGTGSALLAGLILMTSSRFLMQPMAQYADVPLSFYYLATLVLVFFSATPEGIFHKAVVAAMAGAFASFAAWTKNEGLIFFLLSIGCYWLVSLRRRTDVGSLMAPWWYFLIGALPGLLAVGYFKAFLAPSSYFADQTPVQALHKMVEADRYVRIGKSLVTEALRLGDWWANPLLLLAILAIALRLRIDAPQSRPILAVGLTLASLFAAYCGVYIVTPLDLSYHLNTSLDRLYAQMWPTFLFLMFLALETPEEHFGASPKGNA